MENIGEILKNKRLEKGLTLEDVSNLTKIRKKYLEALESGNYNDIPEKVYVKSFLKIYSDFLGLDRAYIVKRYEDLNSSNENAAIMPNLYVPLNNQVSKHKRRNNLLIYIIAGIIGISLIIWGINRVRITSNVSDLVNNEVIRGPSPTEPPGVAPENSLPVIKETETTVKSQHNFDKLTIRIECIANSWISKTIDGKTITAYTMLPNKTESIEAQKRVDLRIGNAAGIKVNANDFDLGVIGKRGEVVDLRITLIPKESLQVEIKRENGSIEKKTFKD